MERRGVRERERDRERMISPELKSSCTPVIHPWAKSTIKIYERLSAIALCVSVFWVLQKKNKNKNVFKYLSVKSLLSSFV